MKTAAQKIQELALAKAIGMFICDDEQLKAYRKLQRALDKGKADEPAMNYCDPYQLYEYDTVKTLIDEIEVAQIGLLEFASEAATIASSKKKDPIPVKDTIKFIDIDCTAVSQRTRDFLKEYYTMYLDKLDTMGEDLIDVNSANEPDANTKSRSKIVREEIKKLSQTADNHGAAYIRFVSF